MAQIKNEIQYKAIMGRIDELFFSTDENTSADDPKLLELDALSALVEEYEREYQAPRLSEIMTGKKTPTYNQARTMVQKLDIDPAIVLAV